MTWRCSVSRHNHVPSLLIGVMSTAESRLMSGLSLVVVVVIVDGGSAVFDVVEVRMLHRLACRYTTTRFVSEHPLQHVIPHKSPNIHYLQHTSDDSTKHEMRLLRMTKQTKCLAHLNQIDAVLTQTRHHFCQVSGWPLRKRRLEVCELTYAWPKFLVWSPYDQLKLCYSNLTVNKFCKIFFFSQQPFS